MEENYIWPEITEDTTLEEVREIHRRIWDYVIEHGRKPPSPYMHNCVLCEYAAVHSHETTLSFSTKRCSFCPAVWGAPCCDYKAADYYWWVESLRCGSKEESRELAQKIRDIPFKET